MLAVGRAENGTVDVADQADAPVPSAPPVVACPHVRTCHSSVPPFAAGTPIPTRSTDGVTVVDCTDVAGVPPLTHVEDPCIR